MNEEPKKKGDVFGNEPIFSIMTLSCGNITCFPFRGYEERKLYTLLNKSYQKTDPLEFARCLIAVVCYPSDKLLNGKNRPTSEDLLTIQDTEKLSIEEVESFCKLYIEYEDYLYRKLVEKEGKGSGGKVISYELGEVEFPKDDKEDYTTYLHRLMVNKESKLTEQAKKLYDQVKGLWDSSGFSAKTLDSIKTMFEMGKSLKDSLKHLEGTADIKALSMNQGFPHYTEIPRLPSDFAIGKTITSKIDELIVLSEKTSAFIVESTETQATIARELKHSSDKATRLSRYALILSIVIIVLTALSICLPVLLQRPDKEVSIKHAIKIEDKLDSLISISRTSTSSSDSILMELRRLQSSDRTSRTRDRIVEKR